MEATPRSRPQGRARAALAVALVPMLLALASCGVVDQLAQGDLADLRVENSLLSFAVIERVEAWSVWTGAYGFDTWLLPGEGEAFEVEPGAYEVELHWADGFVETFDAVTVDPWTGATVVGTH